MKKLIPIVASFARSHKIVCPLLVVVSAAVCSAAVLTQVATPEILPIYHPNQAAIVPMYDDTPGATIFYTVVSGTGPCTTPMHDANGNPIPPTKKITPNVWPTVPVNAVKSFKAVGYKAGLTDSAFTTCVVVDNTQ